MLLQTTPPFLGRGQSGGEPVWTWANLFGPSDDGFYISAIDSTQYQTTSKVTLAEADGDRIGWAEDLSGKGNPAQMATALKRPYVELDGPVRQINFAVSGGNWLQFPDDMSCSGSDNRTFLAYFNTPRTETTLFGLGYDYLVTASSWRVRVNGGYLRIEINSAGYTSSLAVPTTGTQFVAVVFDGTTLADHTLYVGSSSESATGATTLATDPAGTYIARETDPANIFTGNLRLVGFINRALSPSEITQAREYAEGLTS